MLELLFVMALSIIGVVLAVLGVGMAGERKLITTEKIQEKIENASNYAAGRIKKTVETLDNQPVVGGAVAAFTAADGIYRAITKSKDTKETIASLLGTAINTEHAFYRPVSHLGRFGKYASEIAYGSLNIEDEVEGRLGLKKDNRGRLYRSQIKSSLEKYLKEEGLQDYQIDVVERLDENKWAVFDDKNITLAQFVKTAQGEHEQTLSDFIVSIDHERTEREQKAAGNYSGEGSVEAATMKKYREEMELGSKEGNMAKYLSGASKLNANVEYILRQKGAFYKELMANPIISKEVGEHLYDLRKELKAYQFNRHRDVA